MTEAVVCTDCGGSGRGTSFTRPDDPCRTCGGSGKRPDPTPDPPKRDAEWLRKAAKRLDEHEAEAWRQMR